MANQRDGGDPRDDAWGLPLEWRAALDGDLTYASGQTKIALQKPTFSVRSDKQAMTLSDFKAGLWEGSVVAPEVKVLLPAKEQKVRIETQLTSTARSRDPSGRASARVRSSRVSRA